MHKSQVFFYLLIASISGIFISSFDLLSLTSLLVLIIVGIFVLCLGYKNRPVLLIGFLILAFVLGGWRFYSFSQVQDSLGIGIVDTTGYIDSEPEVDGSLQRFVMVINNSRVLVTTNSYPRYAFGDLIKVKGELELPQNFTDFDYVTYLKKDGVGMTLFYPDIDKHGGILKLSFWDDLRLSLYKKIFLLKNNFENAINLSIPEPNAALVNGILLGTRQNIPDDLKDSFSKSGTTHILAISGYNIMIISESILLGLIWFFRRRTAFWISVVVIFLFVIMTGASASIVRAAIMGLLLSFAHGYGRLYDQKNSIILAGAVMIFINPFVLVFDIGFQLSFLAVLGLIYLYPMVDSYLHKVPKLGNLKEITLMTFSAQFTVAPLLIYYFGSFSLISLPTNVLILPFIPAAMLAGFITGLAEMIFLPFGQIFGPIAWAITSYQIWVVRLFSSI